MAKRKQAEEPPKGGWISTFSDLMNLLLCFFIMLFAMSTVDETKFEELVRSLQSSIGLIEGATDSVLDGSLTTTGTQALMELTNAYEQMGINDYENSQSIIEKGKGNQNSDPTDKETTMKKEDTDKTDEERKAETEEEMKKRSQAMAEEIKEDLKQKGIADDVSMNIEAQYVQLTMDGALLFEPGGAKLLEESIPVVNKMGAVLEHYSEYAIEVLGHTDSEPITNFSVYQDNIDLSFARAKTVATYLIENFDSLSIEKMKFSGRGEYEPIASNDTPEGRALNRRVEIRIYNSLSTY